jgi:hypothetical protein
VGGHRLRHRGQSEQAHDVVLGAWIFSSKRLQGALQGRHACPGAFADRVHGQAFETACCHAIQQEVDRPCRLRSGRRSPSGLGHLPDSVLATEPAGEERGPECFEVRLPGRPVVEPFERFGRL